MKFDSEQAVSRRQFLRFIGVGLAPVIVPLLQACGSVPPAPTIPVRPETSEANGLPTLESKEIGIATVTTDVAPTLAPTPTLTSIPKPTPVVNYSSHVDAATAFSNSSQELMNKYRGDFTEPLEEAQNEVGRHVLEGVVLFNSFTSNDKTKALSSEEVVIDGRRYDLEIPNERVFGQVLIENALASFVRGGGEWTRYTDENSLMIEDFASRAEFVDGDRPSMIPVNRMLKLAAIAKTLEDQGRSIPKKWAMAKADSPYARYDQTSGILYYDPYLVLESLGVYVISTDQQLFQDFNSRLDTAKVSLPLPIDLNVFVEINEPARYGNFNEAQENIFANSFAGYMDFGAWARARIAWGEANDSDKSKIMKAQYGALKHSLGFETLASGAIWSPHVFHQGDQAVIYENYDKRDMGSGVIIRQNPADRLRGDLNGAFYERDQVNILSNGSLTYFDLERLAKVMYKVEGYSVVGPLRGWIPEQYLLPLQG